MGLARTCHKEEPKRLRLRVVGARPCLPGRRRLPEQEAGGVLTHPGLPSEKLHRLKSKDRHYASTTGRGQDAWSKAGTKGSSAL